MSKVKLPAWATPNKEDYDFVKVTEIDGSVKEISTGMKLNDPDLVLCTEGDRTYHSFLGCYKNWPPEKQKSFHGWSVLPKKEALKIGLRKCPSCEDLEKIIREDLEEL